MAEPLRIEVVLQSIDRMTGPAREAMGVNRTLANSLAETRKRLAELDRAQRDFDSYKKIKEQLGQLENKLAAAREKAAALAAQFNATSTPSARLTQQFQRARDEVNRLDDRHTQLNQRLQQTRQRITDAGIPMRSLVEAQRSLRTQTEQTTHTLDQQARSMGHLITQQQRLAEQHQRISTARNNMQNTLQLQQDIAGVAAPTMAVGAGMLYSAAKPVMQASNLTDQVKDIAITGNMTNKEESELREQLRALAIATNQEQSELNRGVQILVANGMKGSEAANYAELLGDTATASRAAMDDISNVTFALQNNLKINGKAEMAEAMNNLVHAGKQGQFELKDMAKYFPSMAANMASMGATGQDAAKELAIAMQAARKTTGTAGQAAANMANWFSHMTANSTNEHFASVGIDLKAEMLKRMQNADPAKRMSAFTASIDVFDQYIDKITAGKTIDVKTKKGKVIQSMNFRDALENAKASGNEAEVSSIIERFGLSKVIQDMQTANFYLAMRQNKGFINKGMQSFNAPNVQQTIANDKAERMQSPIEQFKAARIAFDDTLVQAGDTILPIITPLVKQITDIAKATTSWAKENPALVSGLIKVAAVVGVAMVAFGGVTMFLLSIVGPMAMFRYAMTLAASHFSLLRIAAGGLGGVFGAVKAGVLLAGNAILWLGRALMMNPIGLAATAIAGAAYLIYNNWETIKPALSSFWDSIKHGWDTMYGYVSDFVKNVLGFFSDLPNALLSIGQNTITGLLNGLMGGANSVFEWVTSFFGGIVTKAKELLGIQSPSTVFAEIGGFLVDGMLQGITNGWEKLTGYFDEAINGMKEKWQGVVDWFGNTKVGMALGDIKGNLSGTMGKASGYISQVYNTVSTGIKNTAIEKYHSAKNFVKETYESVRGSLASIINGGESGKAGYNAYNRGTIGNKILGSVGHRNLEAMTIAEIQADMRRSKSDTRRLFAVGKYQMIPDTLNAAVKTLGIDTNQKFDKGMQEKLFADYLLDKKRPQIAAYIKGKNNNATGAQMAASQEWASIANPMTGRSFYDKHGGNAASISSTKIMAGMNAAKAKYKELVASGVNETAAYRKAVASSMTQAAVMQQKTGAENETLKEYTAKKLPKVTHYYQEAKKGAHDFADKVAPPVKKFFNNLLPFGDTPIKNITARALGNTEIPMIGAKNITARALGNAEIPMMGAKNITARALGNAEIPMMGAKNITARALGNAEIPMMGAKNITARALGNAEIPMMGAQNPLPSAQILTDYSILGSRPQATLPSSYAGSETMPTSLGYLQEMGGSALGGIANMAQKLAAPFLGSKPGLAQKLAAPFLGNKTDVPAINPIVNLAKNNVLPFSPASKPGGVASQINNLVGGGNLQANGENHSPVNNVIPFAPKATAPASNPMGGGGGTVVNQTITITVNAEKGMDERAIAHEVAKQLREHERKAEIKYRGRMYDG